MAISLPDGRELSDEVLEFLRLRALHGIELGYTETALAGLFGVSRETICRWWTAYVSGGLDALPEGRPGRPLGSGRLLSEEQANRIKTLIGENTPEKLEIASPLWTRRAVRDLIRKEFGIDLAERTVGEYLHRWNYTPKKPERHPRKQDPEEVRKWLEETYPAIEKRAAEEGGEIHWCDETGAVADHHPGTSYSPQGEPATMAVPRPHIRMNQISSITNEGTARFMTYKGRMNTTLFLTFLNQLLRTVTKKVFLIVDRLDAHDNDEVEAWVDAHKDRIEIFYLPKYSPELNPVEYMNNDMKANINKEGLPDDKEILRTRMRRFMRRLQRLPGYVISYFLHPAVQYANAFDL